MGEPGRNGVGTDHRKALCEEKPCLKMLAFINAIHEFPNLTDPSLGQDCWIDVEASQVTYAAVEMTNQSLTHKRDMFKGATCSSHRKSPTYEKYKGLHQTS